MSPSLLVPFFLSVLTLAGCASLSTAGSEPSSTKAGLSPQGARITDERILGDRQTLEAVQQRLRALNEAGVPQSNYALAKAQCWLDTAKTQYHENDRTGYVAESLAESVRITQVLEADRNARAGQATPLVARSVRLREDLWTRLEGFKSNAATLSCNAQTVACAEVRLVRAGHAMEQTGWRQATPHVAMVEDAVRRAEAEAARCAAPVVAAPAAPVAPTPPPAAAPAVVHKESIVLLGDALFRFDKAGQDDLLPGGLERLREVAERFRQYRSIESLRFTGHTDRWGSEEHNDALSLQRAETVRAYLESLGVKAEQTSASGRGAREPGVICSTKPPKAQQVVCLQPNRRVTIEVLGVK
ncbi:MAG: OmpA family protein [Hydrogenophaga sp.]|nr:OmpA family protein [Hydrogenophaga sp.]